MDDSRRTVTSPATANVVADPVANPPANPIDAILQIIRDGERFLVCSHSRPDGDAVGSVLAMGKFLEQIGKRADLVTADRIPAVYRKLPGAIGMRTAMRVHGPYDAAILLECDSAERTRLRGLERFPIVNIDHHASGRAWGQVNWIDREAASVGELVYRLIKAADATITPEIATCLYTTLLTDTGGFIYGGVRASTFALAAELVIAGADPIRISKDTYFCTPMSKLLLLGAALNNLHREGRIAWMWITHHDMVRTCAAEEDCEGIVNYALSIADVEAAVFLRELPEQRIRMSLRSKGKINVAAIAEGLGGGGHENAAGCTVDGPLGRALEEILTELRPRVAAGAAKHGSGSG
jgi:phosphoesterase RecJ-like protein